jgi:hypothetical protein
MIFWTLAGFVAGLVVGTVAIRSDFFRDMGVLDGAGGVVHGERGGDAQRGKPNCQVISGSNNGNNVTRDHCYGCGGTRWVWVSVRPMGCT